MSNYRRLISYIYSYEGGVKGKNIGFAKLETRGSQCKITVSVKKVYVGGNDIGVYLLSTDREIFLGNIFIRGGSGEYRTTVLESNVEQSGIPVDQCYGLTIHDVDNTWRSYTTIWEDSVAHAAAVDLAGAVKDSKDKTTGTISDEQIKRAVREIAEEFPTEQAPERVSNVNVRQGRSFHETQPSEQAVLHSSEEKLSVAEDINRIAAEEDVIRDEETKEEDVAGQEKAANESIPVENISGEETLEAGSTNVESSSVTQQADITEESGFEENNNNQEYSTESSSQIVVETEADSEQSEGSQEEEFLEDQLYSEADYLTSDAQSEEPVASEAQSDAGEQQEDQQQTEYYQDQQQTGYNQNRQQTEYYQNQQQTQYYQNQQQADYLQNQEEEFHNAVWDKLRREHPKILAFDYSKGCEILTIKPQDIGLLPREEWVYGNNSFLLHGYYNYRYLILAKLNNPQGTPRYLLGVPGHYYSNERYMASMFGFPNFVLSKEQPMEDGRFGYWYTDVKVGV